MLGVDVTPHVVDTVNSGKVHIEEVDLDGLVQGVVARGTLRASLAVEPDLLVLAAPTADPAVLRELSEAATDLGLQVKVLPSMSELFGAPTSGDLHDLDLTDLLGRTPVQLDTELVGEHIAGAGQTGTTQNSGPAGALGGLLGGR